MRPPDQGVRVQGRFREGSGKVQGRMRPPDQPLDRATSPRSTATSCEITVLHRASASFTYDGGHSSADLLAGWRCELASCRKGLRKELRKGSGRGGPPSAHTLHVWWLGEVELQELYWLGEVGGRRRAP